MAVSKQAEGLYAVGGSLILGHHGLAGGRDQCIAQTSAPREPPMDIHDKTHARLDVKNSDVSGSVFDNVNMSGWTAHNVNMSGFRVANANLTGLHVADANLAGATISNCRIDGMTIDGVSVADALAAYRQSRAAQG